MRVEREEAYVNTQGADRPERTAGFQHVFVSNVWLDPVFVAGAIGLPIALSSNMITVLRRLPN
mgnify:CR=1 FL=1|jgi:NCS2 family nucleobase:cation symporter-2